MSTPLCSEPEFAQILKCMVANEAPRLFAIVQERRTRADARIAAWGIAFESHAEVVSVESDRRMSLQAPESALRLFDSADEVTAHLIWADQAAQHAPDDDSA